MFRSLALALGLAVAALPAQAGSLDYLWTPRSQEERTAVEVGMLAYTIARAMKSDAKVRQSGKGLAAAIDQSGGGHFALIDQQGRDHAASITQTGRGNGFAVIQRGRGTNADIHQSGLGGVGVLFQFGW